MIFLPRHSVEISTCYFVLSCCLYDEESYSWKQRASWFDICMNSSCNFESGSRS